MLDPFFCQNVPLGKWCVRAWYFIIFFVIGFLIWKFVIPKGKRL